MNIRAKKVASAFVREISYIIMQEVKDPEIKFVTITGCEVTNDFSYAKVYFTVLNGNKEQAIEALNRASNFIEIELSKKVGIRKMPDISFYYDESIDYGNRIEQKIKELNER